MNFLKGKKKDQAADAQQEGALALPPVQLPSPKSTPKKDVGAGIGGMAIQEARIPETPVSPQTAVVPSQEVQPYVANDAASAAPVKRSVNVLEMLEFVKTLEVDPVKEAEMMWIAEEAFHAQLPPGWEEHTDEHGRVYFHNMATGESCWQHPMDGLFKQIVEYWRRVHTTGGFWEIEDELQEIEDQIRRELNEWMELFDEHAEKFYYNRQTEESRFDDPRNGMYHDLYARIRMVAKMKEKLPLLAKAPRPEEPTQAELKLRAMQEEEQQRYMDCIIRIQCAVRTLIAVHRVSAKKNQQLLDKGVQPLKHRVQLRLHKPKAGMKRGSIDFSQPAAPRRIVRREVVLKETNDHRRYKAAQRIQARIRGIKTRREMVPVITHRIYLNKAVTKVQRRMREILKVKREAREREKFRWNAALLIQTVFRALKARRFVQRMLAEKYRFKNMLEGVSKIQRRVRMHLGWMDVQRQLEVGRHDYVRTMQKVSKAYLAQKRLIKLQRENEPFEMVMVHTQDAEIQRTQPWTWSLFIHPVDRRGRATLDPTYAPIDLFSKQGPTSYKVKAATMLQVLVRKKIAAKRANRRRVVVNWLTSEFINRGYNEYANRRNAATKIQKHVRGILVRKLDHIGTRYRKWLEKVQPQAQQTEAYLLRILAQEWLMQFVEHSGDDKAASLIQAHWRGWMARRQVELMTEEVLWPMKGWFEYSAISEDSIRVEAQFFANPRFDECRHFLAFGGKPKGWRGYNDVLDFRMVNMDDQIEKAEELADKREGKKTKKELAKEAEEAEARRLVEEAEEAKRQAEEAEEAKRLADEAERQAIEAADKPASAVGSKASSRLPAGSRASSTAGSKRPSKQTTEARGEDEAPAASKRPSRGEASDLPAGEQRAASSAAPVAQSDAADTKGSAKHGPGVSPLEIDRPKSPDPVDPGEWSPRRGHLSPGVAARERGEKERPQPKAHPLVERATSQKALEQDIVTSPMAKVAPLAAPKAQAEPPADAQPPAAAKAEGEDSDEEPDDDSGDERKKASKEPTESKRPSKEVTEVQEAAQESVPAQPVEEPPCALQVLRDAAVEGGLSTSSRAAVALTAPRKHYGGSYANGQFIRTNAQKLEDLTEDERTQVMADIVEERRRKVDELVRRQKKHASRRKKEQLREVEKLGGTAAGQFFEEEHRKRKVRELKNWLKKKEGEISVSKPETISMEKFSKAASKAPAMDKLEQEQHEMLQRRVRVADQHRTALAQSMATITPADRVLHRHVHHHVHHHDGNEETFVQSMVGQQPAYMQGGRMGMMQSYSAADLRSAPYGVDNRVTEGMPWRPLVHSASAGQIPASVGTVSGHGNPQFMNANTAPYGLDRTVATFPAPPPGASWPQPPLQGMPMPPVASRPGVRS